MIADGETQNASRMSCIKPTAKLSAAKISFREKPGSLSPLPEVTLEKFVLKRKKTNVGIVIVNSSSSSSSSSIFPPMITCGLLRPFTEEVTTY